MTNRARSLLRLPRGTEGFYFDEAYRHRRLTAKIEELLYRCGYLPVQTPVFDFFDAYEPLFRTEDVKNVYRLIDREGDLLLLRSDITLFLARQMGMALGDDDLPVRVCYFDTILRHQNAEDISRNEFFQIGAELIGKPGLSGDLEMVLLLTDVLDSIPLDGYSLHLGSRSFFDTVFASIDEPARLRLARSVAMRNFGSFRDILTASGTQRSDIDYLERMFRHIGPCDEFESIVAEGTRRKLLSADAVGAAGDLSKMWRTVAELGRIDRFRIDLSEVGAQPYYTGTVFQVYIDGAESSIASGGRYDSLLATFGFDAPSVGFSIMLRKVEAILEQRDASPRPAAPERVESDDFVSAYRRAVAIRNAGGSAIVW